MQNGPCCDTKIKVKRLQNEKWVGPKKEKVETRTLHHDA